MKIITDFNYRRLLGGIVMAFFASSCQLDDSQSMELQEDSETINATTSLTGLLYSESFEGSDILQGTKVQRSTDYGFNIVGSNVFMGDKAARLELRQSDDLASNGTRTEILFSHIPDSREKWYSFAAYFPSDAFQYDSRNESLSQWHQGMGSPALSLRVAKDKFYIRTLPTESGSKWKNLYFGNVEKDTWNEFVIHVVHSQTSKGLVEIWKNGRKVLTYNGPNNYDKGVLPHWKLGIYKAVWNNNTTDTRRRVVYYDNIKIADENGSLSKMSSDYSFAESPSPTEDYKEITLSPVNAHTETVQGLLHKGEIIRLHELGTHKLNIQANTDERVRSVRFILYKELSDGSNQKLHSYTDTKAPFALFGDDGNGNYYYGNRHLDYGKYRIVATAYLDQDMNIPVGDVYTSTFKIAR